MSTKHYTEEQIKTDPLTHTAQWRGLVEGGDN